MNPNYKEELDKILSGKKDTPDAVEKPKDNDSYENKSITYNEDGQYLMFISFVNLDQKRFFLNYGNLKSCEYDPTVQRIKLTFSENLIELGGIHLEKLYYKLMENQVKEIIQLDKRYAAISGNIPTVFELKII